MRHVRLFRGPEHPCSYLSGRVARSAYADDGIEMNVLLYSQLAEKGFRRSGDLVYRPDCAVCKACIPIRIPVSRFSPNRSQRRNLRQNSDLTVIRKPAEFQEEHYQLFQRYLAARHEDGGMANCGRDEYMDFLGSSWAATSFVEFRSKKKLMAVAVVDRLASGLSAVYSFFDPEPSMPGLGTLAVLWQIGEAKRLDLEWVYLGFWIAECRKMSYKDKFRPLEAMIDGRWWSFEKDKSIAFDS